MRAMQVIRSFVFCRICVLLLNCFCIWKWMQICDKIKTSSVAAGFGWRGMPPTVCNPDIWPFDLETGVRVASKVENLHSKFGYAMPLGSRIIRYVRDRRTDTQVDRQTDRRTDKSNAHWWLPPSLRSGHNNVRSYHMLSLHVHEIV